ncbi:alkylation response protein AidB-like acyl-CoA dehydrogenase [Streptomyces aurantiacus]|uniref:flavin-dependent monooxygenase n=1 Tax=Streptomyces aurantiacus TaxID=47760 RepID=UPI00279390C7|nr:flavin-dependent monooxygenase [Streptomyces aurantiacus]MDQ0779313.1 alkylation response protein AidB-like acyl-CoA dehydrogenase [Streptomyces aurantiacus]
MSDAGIVERVRELRPLIRENAVRAERERRVPDEVVAALTGTGVHRMNVPRRYGGYQTPLHTQIDAFTEIAVECASTAWVTLGQAGVSYIAALFPDEAQDDFFTGPSGPDVRIGGTLVPGATAVPCDGGYRVDGASGFATGCHHADWHLLTAAVAPADGRPQEGPPEMLWVAVPMSELEILDDWDVTGLAGTGSNTVVARNIPVPAHRVLPVGPMLAGWTPSKANADDPFYRMPVLLLFCAWAASAALGLGRAAMTEFTGRIHRRGITYTFHERQNEATVTHLQAAEAQMRISAAELVAARLIAEIETKARDGSPYTPRERARIRAESGYLTRLCKEAVDLLASAAGASSLRRDVPMQRIARDIQALCLHSFVNPATNLEIYGRVLSGVDPGTPFL